MNPGRVRAALVRKSTDPGVAARAQLVGLRAGGA
jgi:hypothetical protein